MNLVLKIFTSLVLFTSILYGCAMCKADIPIVDVKGYIIPNETNTTFDITWTFSKEYMDTLSIYDMNENGKFDQNEQQDIQNTLTGYIKKLNYLTDIIYNKKEFKFTLNNLSIIQPHKESFEFKNGQMYYNYSFTLDFKLQKDHKLYMGFYDKEGNFVFKLKDSILKNYEGIKSIEPQEFYTYYYFYKKDIALKESQPTPEPKKISFKKEKKDDIKTDTIEEKTDDETVTELLGKQLEKIKNSIQELLNDIKQNNSLSSYIWLLFFSFIYGIIHAMGPGHGKSLISAYFMSQDRSYIKALNMSLLIGVVHTFSAFLLTLVIYYILGVMFANSATDIEQTATKVSAMIIIAIALYLIYKKLPKKQKISSFKTAPNQSFVKTTPIINHTSSCSCSGCNTHSTDIGVILAAGIIPCPGTVTIFIFTMSLGVYFVGFLSAVFMSLGMSLIIFISALLTIKIKQRTNTNDTIKKVFEYGSLVFILFLGIILLVY
ncbi:MAG: hypothetical protein U9Q33_02495 [Campylobacterota bacterium]|nr:hypothetical protein [Campylobacterota bacterium]